MTDPPREDHAPASELTSRLQFLHPDRTLALWELSHCPEDDTQLLASIVGTDSSSYQEARRHFADQARQAAVGLLDDQQTRRNLRQLPFANGDVVVAVGDSITADYQSWFEILRSAITLGRRDLSIRLLNHGISGDTTLDLLRRLWHTANARPTWLIVLIGTNDARTDRQTGTMLITHAETARNLERIRHRAQRIARRLIWIAPPPVDEQRIASNEVAARRDAMWRNVDVAQKSRLVRMQHGPVVDLDPPFTAAAGGTLLLPDGLHPSLAGQQTIAGELIRTLAGCDPSAAP